MATVTQTETKSKSILSIVSRRVEPEDYVKFRVGYTCKRLSDNFTPSDQVDQNKSYVFQEQVSGEPSNRDKRKLQDEDGESTGPNKKQRAENLPVSADVFEACLAMAMKKLEASNEEKENARLRQQKEQEERLRSEIDARLREQQELEERLRSEIDARLREQQEREERLRSELQQEQARAREELQLVKADVERLKAYQDAGTCQKLATTALIEFACNLLSWGLRRFISWDIHKDETLRKSLLTGRNRPFTSWNSVSYKKLQWILYWAWRDEQMVISADTSLAEYWRRNGYSGCVLWEPAPLRKTRDPEKYLRNQRGNLTRIRGYLERAERDLAELLGLPIINPETGNQVSREEDEESRTRLRTLCGLYSTWISGERNQEVHMFGLYPNFWDCDMTETEEEEERRNRQEEDMVELVPARKLSDARVMPKLRSFELHDLQVKLRVLNMVLRDIRLLPEFFILLEEDIRLLGKLVKKCITQAAGLAIRRQREGSEVPGTNLWLFGGGLVVSSRVPGKRWRITEAGLWLNDEDKSALDDPSALLLGEE